MILIAPVRDTSGAVITSLELVNETGRKTALHGGRRSGCFWSTGRLEGASLILVGEGIATVKSAVAALGEGVGVACGNLAPVARALRERHPAVRLLILGDVGNSEGDARRAASEVGAVCAVPSFSETEVADWQAAHGGKNPSDWNDAALIRGTDAVGSALRAAMETPPPQKTNSLRVVTAHELLDMTIPIREHVIEPWLPTQGLGIEYGPRGCGKTLVALGVAYAVATGGSFLGWKAPKPRRVLYLDGEMPLPTMQSRVAEIVGREDLSPPSPDFFRLVNPDLQERGFNLGTPEGRSQIEPLLEGTELVVVDNISTLASVGRENEAESWLPLQEWALDLRRRGMSVLFVHHAGKSRAQRGTSRREDVMDSVIALRRPQDYDPREGARFEVHYEKARGFSGDTAAPFCAQLTPDGWRTQTLENAREAEVIMLAAEGLKQRAIAQEIGISLSTVNRILKANRAGEAA